MNFKKGHSVGIVEPQDISGRECEVNPSEGVGPVLPTHCSSHNRTGHFGEHGRSCAVRAEELEFYGSVSATTDHTSTTYYYTPIPYYTAPRGVRCWDYVLIVRMKGATIVASLWWDDGWLAPVALSFNTEDEVYGE
jgi:hypothetical protein